MKKSLVRSLEKIFSDKSSGSEELLFRLNTFLKVNFLKIDNPLLLIKDLKKHFKSFQKIQDYLTAMSKLISAGRISAEFFQLYIKNTTISYDKIFRNALPFLKNEKKILTISNSKTVFEVLKRLSAHNKNLQIIISESRPRLEGRILAKKLLSNDISAEIITEAMMAKNVPTCDCVLIGSDTVLKSNGVVNKMGSLQLALLCKNYDKPFYVVSSKSKFSAKKRVIQNQEDSNEIWKNAPKKIAINNFYFELVPNRLITRIITE